MKIANFKFVSKGLSLGDLKGNLFHLILRFVNVDEKSFHQNFSLV